jgi:N utilization substance protein B
MGIRRKSRELALQMLFQAEMGKQSAEHVQKTFWSHREDVDGESRGFAEDLFRAARDHAAEIDGLIQKHAEHWRLERMAAVDRNLLRAAVAEALVFKTPAPVVINEALEIARKFSGPESVHFINGVLDSICREMAATRP